MTSLVSAPSLEGGKLRANVQTAWAILWRSENRLDGKQEHLVGTPYHPCRTVLFDTRQEARAFIAEQYGYIRNHPDLRAEPFGWKMPQAVRVKIVVAVDKEAA